MTLTFDQIADTCKQLAQTFGIECEIKDYSNYGWKGISLLVDHFGGCAVNLCYLLETKRCYDWIHSSREVEITDLDQLRKYAGRKIEREKKVRLTEDLCDFINSQY